MTTLTCSFGDPAAVAHPLGTVRYGTAAVPPAIRDGHPALGVHLTHLTDAGGSSRR